ncbi:MAG: hypothetical protein NTY81_01575 [Candidatus Staskawiczbacteria bacterium]|nr:hypothetical protein [Candidatus Staskawiczbacteria bacterium]
MLTPKKAEKIQDAILYEMAPEEKLRLSFRINGKIIKIARDKMKLKYPKLDIPSFSKKLYEHFDRKEEFYDNLFNKFMAEELKI